MHRFVAAMSKTSITTAALDKANEDLTAGGAILALHKFSHRYSLDHSLNSFSLSPGDSSSLCDRLSREASLLQDTSSSCADFQVIQVGKKMKFAKSNADAAAAAGGRDHQQLPIESSGSLNPIDGLYSMQTSYFDA